MSRIYSLHVIVEYKEEYAHLPDIMSFVDEVIDKAQEGGYVRSAVLTLPPDTTDIKIV